MKTSRTILWVIAALIVAGLIVWYTLAQRPSTDLDATSDAADTELLDESTEDLEALEESVNASEDEVLGLESTDDAVDNTEQADEEIGDIVDVTVTASGFEPKSLTIKTGDTVIWTNNADRTVFIAPDDHPTHTKYAGVWDDDGTGNIAVDESYEFTFEQAGAYTYHNHLQPTVTGTIVAE